MKDTSPNLKNFTIMTIRISATVLLIKPRCVESARYLRTTSRAVTQVPEHDGLEFELKFFYDLENPDLNTVPNSYGANEIIQFTGNLTEVTNKVLCINVQHATSHGLGIIPCDYIEINLSGCVRSTPQAITTPATTSDSTDNNTTTSNPSNFTTFNVTATEWISLPRNKSTASIRGKNVEFDFVVHHRPYHRLANRTTYLSLSQTVNILGLLELINDQLYIQLTDISWTSTTTNSRSGTQQQSRSNQTIERPSLTATRALAASLSSSQSKTSSTTTATTTRKRERSKVSSQSDDDSTVQEPNQPELQYSTSDNTTQTKVSRNLRSSNRTKRKSNQNDQNSEGNEGNYPASKYTPPALEMVAGIPQLSNSRNTQTHKHVKKLRDHATNLLPNRSFSFF